MVEDCIASVLAGNSLVIFPEGTRTAVSGEMKLQRGAANIATRGPCNITPVIIRCAPLALSKGVPWWRIASRRMQYDIEVRDDIVVAPFLAQSAGEPAIAARKLTEYLHTYFSTEYRAHAGA